MDLIVELSRCNDGSCCCLPIKYSVAMISLLSTMLCLVDILILNSNKTCCSMKEYVEGAKQVLQWLFQIANFLLLGSVVTENVLLVSVYLWFTLNYVVLGLCVAILELLCEFVHDGAHSVAVFCCEVGFFFMLSRCLPIVNSYKKELDVCTSSSYY